jgi:hypothetical protein
MNQFKHAKVETSGGVELGWQNQHLAFLLGLDADQMSGSTWQYAFPLEILGRLILDNDEFYLGPRIGFVTFDGNGASATGWEYGVVAGDQWGSGKLALGISFGINEVFYTHVCLGGKCANGTTDGIYVYTIRFTLAM